jgi:hypothetical protein
MWSGVLYRLSTAFASAPNSVVGVTLVFPTKGLKGWDSDWMFNKARYTTSTWARDLVLDVGDHRVEAIPHMPGVIRGRKSCVAAQWSMEARLLYAEILKEPWPGWALYTPWIYLCTFSNAQASTHLRKPISLFIFVKAWVCSCPEVTGVDVSTTEVL